VLVHGARMPPADQLPEAIRALALQAAVAGAPGAAGVREWPIMSRWPGPGARPKAMGLRETRCNSQIPAVFPHRVPV